MWLMGTLTSPGIRKMQMKIAGTMFTPIGWKIKKQMQEENVGLQTGTTTPENTSIQALRQTGIPGD
jgi:hypothetical protein